jgi:competence protein ComEC
MGAAAGNVRDGRSVFGRKAMRDSGLAHILAISGMHMVIMAGTWFWLVRGAWRCFRRWRFDTRSAWAAVAALFGAAFYLALSGGAVPTIRAWIMMSIMLLAILLDRPAISMRNVALAALIILAWTPEILFSPSFQMSFAAVVGLIAVYERQRPQIWQLV